MSEPGLNAAVDQLLLVTSQIAAQNNCSPVDLLLFATAAGTMGQLTTEEAHTHFATARTQLASRGMTEKV